MRPLRLIVVVVSVATALIACNGQRSPDEDPKKLTREKAADLLRQAIDGPVTTIGLSTSAEHVEKLLSPDQRSRYFCHHYFQGSAENAAGRCTRSTAAVMSADCNEGQARIIGAGLAELVFLANTRRLGGHYGHAHYCVALTTPELAKYQRAERYVVGERHLAEVTGMTEPAPMQGRTMSEVSFRVRKEENDLGRLIAGVFLDAGTEPEEDRSGTAILVLYDDGWRVESDTVRFE